MIHELPPDKAECVILITGPVICLVTCVHLRRCGATWLFYASYNEPWHYILKYGVIYSTECCFERT
jgi:hypothetical protein